MRGVELVDELDQRLLLGAVGSLAWFAVGAFFLFRLPTIALMSGFTFPFLVLLLKALSLVLLESTLWRRRVGIERGSRGRRGLRGVLSPR